MAKLHCACLPGSLISKVGDTYAQQFYDYAARSASEIVLAAREGGELVGGALVSLDTDSIAWRMIRGTPLFFHILRRPFSPAARTITFDRLRRGPRDRVEVGMPEVVALFTAAQHRGRRIGAALLSRAEALISARGFSEYAVRTEDHAGNRAVGFYEREGFVTTRIFTTGGVRFRLMMKALPQGATRATRACTSEILGRP